jgi:hypothetical protein
MLPYDPARAAQFGGMSTQWAPLTQHASSVHSPVHHWSHRTRSGLWHRRLPSGHGYGSLESGLGCMHVAALAAVEPPPQPQQAVMAETVASLKLSVHRR